MTTETYECVKLPTDLFWIKFEDDINQIHKDGYFYDIKRNMTVTIPIKKMKMHWFEKMRIDSFIRPRIGQFPIWRKGEMIFFEATISQNKQTEHVLLVTVADNIDQFKMGNKKAMVDMLDAKFILSKNFKRK